MKKLVLFVLFMLAVCPLVFGANIIKKKGMDQGTLVQVLKSHETAINAQSSTIADINSDVDTGVNTLATNMSDILHNNGVIQMDAAEGSNNLLGTPGLAKGTTTQTLKTTHDFSYTINGEFYYKAATDDWCDFAGQTDLLLATGRYQAYEVSIKADGSCEINSCDPKTSAALRDSECSASGSIALGTGVSVGVVKIGAASDHDFSAEDIDSDGLEIVGPLFNADRIPLVESLTPTASNPGTVGTGTESDPAVDVSLDI